VIDAVEGRDVKAQKVVTVLVGLLIYIYIYNIMSTKRL